MAVLTLVSLSAFAQFVQDHDPLFDKMRVAWTLCRQTVTDREWSFPTTGGYTVVDPSGDSTPSSSTNYPSTGSTTSFPFSQPRVQFQSSYSVVRANRPPSPAWAIRKRGMGWGIVPMQGPRAEIKFGPKGKWRVESARSKSRAKGKESAGLDEVRRRREKATELSGVGNESRGTSRTHSWADEKDDGNSRVGNDGARVTFGDEYMSLSGVRESIVSILLFFSFFEQSRRL